MKAYPNLILMNNPFYLKYSFLLVITLSFFACVKPTTRSVALDDKVNNYVDSIVQPFLDSSQLAGTTIGIAQGDRIIFLKSYGFSDLEAKTPLPVGATFEIASITKSFTALSIMQLMQKGRLHLDDDIRKYIAFDTKAKVVTIRQLLNHTSGITDYTRSAIPSKLKGLEFYKDTVAQML